MTALEAIRAVIAYNYADEERDYIDNGCEPGHIFEALVKLVEEFGEGDE